MSLSLALGILVSDLSGYRLLTSAHAHEGTCGVQGTGGTVVSNSVKIADGLILSGITVRNVVVNGSVLEQAVIAGSVQISNATVVGGTSVIYTEGNLNSEPGGVIVGVDSPCTNGVIVGVDNPNPNGVIVGVDNPNPNGVIVGVDNPTSLGGVTATASGTAVGGTLTGDNITVTSGVITGQNLLLSGVTLNSGSISGTITSVTISPAN